MSKYMDVRELFPGGEKDEWRDIFGRTRSEIQAADREFTQRVLAIKRTQCIYHPKSLSDTLGEHMIIKPIEIGDR